MIKMLKRQTFGKLQSKVRWECELIRVATPTTSLSHPIPSLEPHALPSPQTHNTQLFPIYFGWSAVTLALQLLTGGVIGLGAPAMRCLGLSLAATLLNILYLEPQSTKVMFARYALEDVGKQSSNQYKQLAKEVRVLTGIPCTTRPNSRVFTEDGTHRHRRSRFTPTHVCTYHYKNHDSSASSTGFRRLATWWPWSEPSATAGS